jgi:predicted dehydrogenase
LLAERAASTAEELVDADDVDVVHICTPNHLHTPLAERAMAAGKHVVCEKPLSSGRDNQGYLDCFTAFVADVCAAAAGNPPDGLPPTFADGLRAAVITDAVVTSAASGQWVEVRA